MYIVPLLALAAALNVGFMSRGAPTSGFRRRRHRRNPAGLARDRAFSAATAASCLPARQRAPFARVAVVVALCLTLLSPRAGQGARTARDAGFADGPGELITRGPRRMGRAGHRAGGARRGLGAADF